jgi:predicted phage-related endonuclease
MLCHPDGVTDDGRLFEAKNTRSADGWGEPGTDEIPAEYVVQVQHNMAVTGLEVADVAVLIGGSDFRLFEVPADRETQDLIASLERELWEAIVRGVPPEPRSAADVAALYGRASVERRVTASQEIEAACEALAGLKAHAKIIGGEIEAAEVTIKKALGTADTLVDPAGNILATWRASKPISRFDLDAFRASRPDLAAAFTVAGEPRRPLLLKVSTR